MYSSPRLIPNNKKKPASTKSILAQFLKKYTIISKLSFVDDDPDSVTSIWVDDDDETNRKCHIKFFGGLNGLITRAWVKYNDTEPFAPPFFKNVEKYNTFDDEDSKKNFQFAFREAKIAAKMPLEERKEKYCFFKKQMSSKKKSEPKMQNPFSQYSQFQTYPSSPLKYLRKSKQTKKL